MMCRNRLLMCLLCGLIGLFVHTAYAVEETITIEENAEAKDTTTIYDDDLDITKDTDEKLFADFEKTIEDDLETLFDGISNEEDIEAKTMEPKKLSEEVSESSVVAAEIMKEDIPELEKAKE